MKLAMALVIAACVGSWATPARATLVQMCNWGVGALAPTVFTTPAQVMTTPIVMDFKTPTSATSQVAFVSFNNTSGVSGGVLRVIDSSCTEIARFPDAACSFTLPANCPGNLAAVPQLVPSSGLAAGRLDPTVATPVVDIVGVLDNNRQVIAFNLVGGCLKPKWCSPPLGASNSIPPTAAPAIAQLDGSGTAALRSEVVVDNKVFEYNGAIRYPGPSLGPHSRAVLVANPSGTPLPQLITGGGAYSGGTGGVWAGSLSWQSSVVTNSPLVYPAIADLDMISPGPEIVVTDTMATTLRVLSATGTQLASKKLPNPPWPAVGSSNPHCGGPPMVAKLGTTSVIGVATCNRYTLYVYKTGNGTANSGTLVQRWSQPISNPSGQTTSTFAATPVGALIYYNDATALRVFNASNGGTIVQSVPNTSATAFEGPVLAALAAGPSPGRLIVAASDYNIGLGGNRGVRIFSDSFLGPARDFWNQASYHGSNVNNSSGAIPTIEQPSWHAPFHNMFRVQQYP